MCLIFDIPEDKLSLLQKITLELGPICNINCRHCIQNVAKDLEWNFIVTDKCIETLVRWSKVVKPFQRLLFKKPMLLFYGGEPLLYYSDLKEIVSRLEFAGFDFLAVNLKLFTNGILLSEDMVDYFNKYNFEVVLSFDGPNEYAVRPQIASEKNILLWHKLNNRGITSCLTSFNSDFLETKFFLKNKFDTDNISIEMIYVNWDMPIDIYKFPKCYFERQLCRIISYYEYNRLDKSFLTFTKNFLGKITGHYKNITITLDGHVLNNRFELRSAQNFNNLAEYACDVCEKAIVCPFAGKHSPKFSDCNTGSVFFEAYKKYKTRLENLVLRDYAFLALQNY